MNKHLTTVAAARFAEYARLDAREVAARREEEDARFRARIKDGGDIATDYDTNVFPWEMRSVALASARSTIFDVLYVTIGTQPYSPALSLMATPARKVVAITTRTSHNMLPEVMEKAGLSPKDVEELQFDDEPDPEEMAQVLFYNMQSHAGQSLAVDFTSAWRTMSVVLSDVACAFDAMQFYLFAEQLRPYQFFLRTRRVTMPNIIRMIDILRKDLEAENDSI